MGAVRMREEVVGCQVWRWTEVSELLVTVEAFKVSLTVSWKHMPAFVVEAVRVSGMLRGFEGRWTKEGHCSIVKGALATLVG